jgi:CBS domain-containing protein
MKVSDLMTTAVRSCGTGDNLQLAAQIMWESDCGIVPVVDGDGRVVGVITDRDICMAAYTQGLPLCNRTGMDAVRARRSRDSLGA